MQPNVSTILLASALAALAGGATAHAQPCDTDSIFPQPSMIAVDDPAATDATHAEIADVDGDGDLDLVVIEWETAAFVYLNDGAGNMTRLPQMVGTAFPSDIDVADMDGDGNLDIVMARQTASRAAETDIFLGNGDGTFAGTAAITLTGDFPRLVKAADIDLDGNMDVIAAEFAGEVLIYRSAGGLTFPTVMRMPTDSLATRFLDARDLNGDGLPEIVVINDLDDRIMSILDNRGSGLFDAARAVVLDRAQTFVLEDLNGDGHADIAHSGSFSFILRVRLNDGAGNFPAESTVYATPDRLRWMTGFDVDGDGDTDIFGAIQRAGFVYTTMVFRNDGAGGFLDQSAEVDETVLGPRIPVGGADLNGDGSPEAVLVGLADATSDVHLSIARNFCSAAPVITQQPVATIADAGGSAQFAVRVSAILPSTTFQWRRDGVPLSDGAGINGTDTPDLTINSVEAGALGFYDCVITSIGGERTSQSALLAIRGATNPCPADFDGDGALTLFDFLAFQNAFAAGCP